MSKKKFGTPSYLGREKKNWTDLYIFVAKILILRDACKCVSNDVFCVS
jgi:hypothetical protein